MTPSKRWYQLSMLQLLVVMAVVVVFTLKNASYHLTNARHGIGLISSGWPFTFLVGFGTLATTTSEFVRAGSDIRWNAKIQSVGTDFEYRAVLPLHFCSGDGCFTHNS